MEKIKNILNPGHGADDEILYGSGKHPTADTLGNNSSSTGDGRNTDPTSTRSGVTGSRAAGGGLSDQRGLAQQSSGYENEGTTGTGSTLRDSQAARQGYGSGQQGQQSSGQHYGTDGAIGQAITSDHPSSQSQQSGSQNFGNEGPMDRSSGISRSGAADDTPIMEQTKQQRYGTEGVHGGGSSLLTGSRAEQLPTSGQYGQQFGNQQYGHENALSGASALSTGLGRDHDLDRPNATPSTTGTMASNASIKSGVLGKAPTGSSMEQGLSGNQQQTGDRSFPLSGGQTSNTGSGDYAGRDATRTGGQQIGSADNYSGRDATQSSQPLSSSSEHHTGRDAALLGGVGAAGIGANEAYKRHENHDQTTRSGLSGSHSHGHHGHQGHHEQQLSSDSNRPQTPVEHARAVAQSHDHSGHGHEYTGDPCTPPADGLAGVQHSSGPHSTDTANRLDPHLQGGQSTGSSGDQQHYGRDAALGGAGVGAAGVAYGASRDRDQGQRSGTGYDQNQPTSDSTSSGTTPHSSSLLNKLDPRVKDTNNGSQSSRTQPTQPSETGDRNLGRDAAYAGGAGAAGAAATSAYRKHEDNKTGGAGTGLVTGERGAVGSENNPYSSNAIDPRVDGPGHRKPVESSTRGQTGSNLGSSQQNQPQGHTGRDAALAGGAGAAGLGAYEAKKHHDEKDYASPHPGQTSTGSMGSGNNQSSLPFRGHDREPQQGLGVGSQGVGSQQQNVGLQQQDHTRRNEGLAAGGVGAAGLGAYEAKKHHDEKQSGYGNQGPMSTTTSQSSAPLHSGNNHSNLGYGDQRATGSHPTQDTHSHKGRDAAAIGGIGAAGYGAEHEYSKHEAEKNAKEAERAERHHEKQVDRQTHKHDTHKHEKEEEKKPGLLSRILHRNKDDKDDTTSSDQSRHHKEEAVVGAGGAGAGAGAYSVHEHNKLHKDPPKGYQQGSDSNTNQQGQYGQHGTSGLGQGNQTGEDGRVIDPITGLPIDLSKGDGHGGIDGSSNITGFHATGNEAGRGGSVTDWDAIKKNNTPY